jgi:hypothetical protein
MAWCVLGLRLEERPPIWRVAVNIMYKQSRTALFLSGFIFIPFYTTHFPQGVQIPLQLFYAVFICDFPINYTVISEESNKRVDVPPNIIYLY